MKELERFGYDSLAGITINGKALDKPDKVTPNLEEALKNVIIEWED